MQTVHMQTTAYQTWLEAHRAASRAETAILLQSLAHLQGAGEPPAPSSQEEARDLRKTATAAFVAFVEESSRNESRIRHSEGSIYFAIRMTRVSAEKAARV